MKLGMDCRGALSDELLRSGRQLGATDAIAGGAALARARKNAGPPHLEYGELAQARARVEAAGMKLHAIENLPFTWYGDLFYGGPSASSSSKTGSRRCATWAAPASPFWAIV